MYKTLLIASACIAIFNTSAITQNAKESLPILYFIDGYHGGIKAHMPPWTCQDWMEGLRLDPEWKFSVDIEPLSWDYVRRQDPDSYNKLKEYLANHKGIDTRIEVTSASYAQPYGWVIGGESCIRHLQKGFDILNKHFPGVRIDTYAVQEPCWTSAMPQILKSFGFKRAVLKNSTAWAGYTAGVDKDVVNWVGPDGTSIPTVPKYDCEMVGCTSYIESFGGGLDYSEKCRAHGIKEPTGVCYMDAGWAAVPWLNHGKRIYDITRGGLYIMDIDLKERKDKIVYTTWGDYMDNIAPKPEYDWHFTQEDILCSLPWGDKFLQKLARQVRSAENKSLIAEKLSSMASVLTGMKYPSRDLDDAWIQLMFAEHHDAWICAPYGLDRDNWAWKVSAQTWQAEDLFERATASSAESLAQIDSVKKSDNTRYVRVFNTIAADRKGISEIIVPTEQGTRGVKVFDMTGREIASQVIPMRGYPDHSLLTGTVLFQADTPSMGYSTYRIEPVTDIPAYKGAYASTQQDGIVVIESDLYKIIIDPSKGGIISSLYDKRIRKEFCDRNSDRYFNEYRGYFVKEEKWLSSIDSPAQVKIVENGPVRVCVEIVGNVGGRRFVTSITLCQGQKAIDFHTTFDFGDETWIGDPWKIDLSNLDHILRRSFYNEKFKLQAHFPVDISNTSIYKNAAYDVTKSRLDDTFFETWGEIKNNIILNWADAYSEEDNMGLAVFTDHTTGYSHGKDHPLSLTLAWGWQAGFWWGDSPLKGRQETSYAVIPHAGKWDKAGLWKESGMWNEPMRTQLMEGKPNEDNGSNSILRVSGSGIDVPTILVEGDDLLVRLFNAEGADGSYTVSFPFSPKNVDLIELNGKTIKRLDVIDQNSVEVDMPRFGIRTLRLRDIVPKNKLG